MFVWPIFLSATLTELIAVRLPILCFFTNCKTYWKSVLFELLDQLGQCDNLREKQFDITKHAEETYEIFQKKQLPQKPNSFKMTKNQKKGNAARWFSSKSRQTESVENSTKSFDKKTTYLILKRDRVLLHVTNLKW